MKTGINCQMLVSGCADRESYDTQLLYFTCSSLSRDDRRRDTQENHPHPQSLWVKTQVLGAAYSRPCRARYLTG